jgi:hypothetical protein
LAKKNSFKKKIPKNGNFFAKVFATTKLKFKKFKLKFLLKGLFK